MCVISVENVYAGLIFRSGWSGTLGVSIFIYRALAPCRANSMM